MSRSIFLTSFFEKYLAFGKMNSILIRFARFSAMLNSPLFGGRVKATLLATLFISKIMLRISTSSKCSKRPCAYAMSKVWSLKGKNAASALTMLWLALSASLTANSLRSIPTHVYPYSLNRLMQLLVPEPTSSIWLPRTYSVSLRINSLLKSRRGTKRILCLLPPQYLSQTPNEHNT